MGITAEAIIPEICASCESLVLEKTGVGRSKVEIVAYTVDVAIFVEVKKINSCAHAVNCQTSLKGQ